MYALSSSSNDTPVAEQGISFLLNESYILSSKSAKLCWNRQNYSRLALAGDLAKDI